MTKTENRQPVVLILGGTGFVGSNLIKGLEKDGMRVVHASRATGTDLRDVAQVSVLLRSVRPSTIVNCAAHVGSLNYVTKQAATIVSDNSKIVLGIYEGVVQECPEALVINPIANCAYPAKADTFVEGEWWNGHLHRSVLSYGVTRRLLWAAAECFQMQHGIRSIHLLVPNMYGPLDSTNPDKAHALNALTAKFVKAVEGDQKEIEVWGTGVAIREWLYAPDFARIVSQIISNPGMIGLDEPLNIAQNFGLSVRELAGVISKAAKFKGEIRWNHSMPDGAPRKVMDDRRFRKVFPSFEFTELSSGIEATIAYYESLLPY